MPERYTTLSPGELDGLLGRNETGVLALAQGNTPYAVPVSYGYDDVERTLYFQLVTAPDSEKQSFLGAADTARLVVTERRDGVYRSVIAEGPLRKVFRDELTPEQIHQYSDAKRPLLELWSDAEDIQLYELDPESLTGRAFEAPAAEGP